MRNVPPARECAFLHDLESSQTKHVPPVVFQLKRAWTSASAPLSIVCPAHHAVPPEHGNVFVDDRDPTFAQHAAYFVQYEPRVLCVMQDITEQDSIEALISDRKMPAVVWQVVDARGGAVADVETNDSRTEHAAKMMGDEAVAASDVEYVCAWRKHTRDFERHIVCSSDFSSPSHAAEAAFDDRG